MNANELSQVIIGASLDLHKTLGPGLLESLYETALPYDLRERGFQVKTQVPIPVVYKGVKLEVGFRVGILVENKVLVELKAVENLAPILFSQTLTYLRLSQKKLALLINFNTKLLRNGIRRLVNNL